MHYIGLLIGLCSFLVIGIFHPIVIKGEYYFSSKIWPIFLGVGIGFLGVSIIFSNVLLSSFFSIIGFCCLWSIGELREQEERVKKGWFPSNPKREKVVSSKK